MTKCDVTVMKRSVDFNKQQPPPSKQFRINRICIETARRKSVSISFGRLRKLINCVKYTLLSSLIQKEIKSIGKILGRKVENVPIDNEPANPIYFRDGEGEVHELKVYRDCKDCMDDEKANESTYIFLPSEETWEFSFTVKPTVHFRKLMRMISETNNKRKMMGLPLRRGKMNWRK